MHGLRLLDFDPQQQTSFKTIVAELTEAWPLTRDETVRILNAERILARAYYAPPLHLKPMAYPAISSPLPVTEFYAQRLLLLPCGHFIEQQDIAAVAGLLDFIRRHGAAIRRRCEETAA
jgi:dTDP-4-amino-4,6-dideoxygalactose transaminase